MYSITPLHPLPVSSLPRLALEVVTIRRRGPLPLAGKWFAREVGTREQDTTRFGLSVVLCYSTWYTEYQLI
jgi:hypothetical protein